VQHSQAQTTHHLNKFPPTGFADAVAGTASLVGEAVAANGHALALSDLDVETLMLNLDASLRVYQREHFFSWTQGLLQSLIKHEVIVCAVRSGEPSTLRADSFSMIAAEPSIFGDLFLRDTSVALGLIKAWEDRGFRPLLCDATDSPFSRGLFAQELGRVSATQILAHGTHDALGQACGFYAFICVPGTLGPRQAYLARLVTPFLHAAWMRTEVDGRAKGSNPARREEARRITTREEEILRWVSLGKSNFEVGAILGISPLTVKNHVQKILRKLNVVNRAQAVGKALELRMLRN
jgi:transcriptional regulator EpsA